MAKPSTVKGALINCIVAQEATSDAWYGMVCEVTAHETPQTLDQLKASFAEIEKEVKGVFSITATPASYRSCKTTLLGAIEYGVPLVDSMNVPRNKQDVANDVKSKVPVSADGSGAGSVEDVAAEAGDGGGAEKAVPRSPNVQKYVDEIAAVYEKAVVELSEEDWFRLVEDSQLLLNELKKMKG